MFFRPLDLTYSREYEKASLTAASAKANFRATQINNKIRLATTRAAAVTLTIEAEGNKSAVIAEAEGKAEASKIEAAARDEAAHMMTDDFARQLMLANLQVDLAGAINANELTVIPEDCLSISIVGAPSRQRPRPPEQKSLRPPAQDVALSANTVNPIPNASLLDDMNLQVDDIKYDPLFHPPSKQPQKQQPQQSQKLLQLQQQKQPLQQLLQQRQQLQQPQPQQQRQQLLQQRQQLLQLQQLQLHQAQQTNRVSQNRASAYGNVVKARGGYTVQ